jgi:hypothetical protein
MQPVQLSTPVLSKDRKIRRAGPHLSSVKGALPSIGEIRLLTQPRY